MGKIVEKQCIAVADRLISNDYRRRYQTFLRINHRRDLQSGERRGDLISLLCQKIREQKPFALVRMGDGEGNCLFWYFFKHDYPELAELCMTRIWRVMFGRAPFQEPYWDRLAHGIVDSLNACDFIGMPTIEQFTQAANRLGLALDQSIDIRGSVGVASVWPSFSLSSAATPSYRSFVVEWHCHKLLLTNFSAILEAAQTSQVSAISCYDNILDALAARYSLNKGILIKIPPQASNIGVTPDAVHFPDRYSEICSEISNTTFGGHLFLVAAGLPGKEYCRRIRDRGGMALDIGSIVDAWLGHSVRPYQTPEFVSQHNLHAKEPGSAR